MTDPASHYSHAATVLPVTDLARSRDYYRDVLGFSVEFEWEDPPTYAVLRAGDALRLHLALRDGPLDPGGRRTVLYVFVRDVDGLHRSLVDRGVDVLRPLETADYGMREFEVVDPDGHRLVFGQGV